VELCADGLGHALLDKAEQFGFDVVAGEFDRELLGALTVARLGKDLINGIPDASGVAWLAETGADNVAVAEFRKAAEVDPDFAVA
jgi:hypothetical protein